MELDAEVLAVADEEADEASVVDAVEAVAEVSQEAEIEDGVVRGALAAAVVVVVASQEDVVAVDSAVEAGATNLMLV